MIFGRGQSRTPRWLVSRSEARGGVLAECAALLGVSRGHILVTSAFHMRRAGVLLTRAGFQVVPFPVDVRVSAGRACTMLDLLPNASRLSQTETALRAMR